VAQHVSGASTPIIRSLQIHLQPLVLPLESGGSSVVGRGLADHDQQCGYHLSEFVRSRATLTPVTSMMVAVFHPL